MSALLNPFFLTLALSLGLVPLCRAIALRMGRVAHPRADRWHQRPIALLGGVAISLSMLVGAVIFGVARDAPVLVV